MTPPPDSIAIANLVVSAVTALCAIYIAFLALRHTAKPRIDVMLLRSGDELLGCNTEILFNLEVRNVGYWYAAAPAINITVYCNFDPAFAPLELRYGSTQETTNTHVRIGKGGVKYLKAEGLKLSRRDEAERIHVLAKTPGYPGNFVIKVTAFSEEGASITREFQVKCDI
jgi:hypothetical protein